MKKLLLSLLLVVVNLQAKNEANGNIESIKTSCIQQSNYADKTLAEQKKILIEKAKQESLEELYGALIFSSTDIENGQMKRDEIKSRAVGAVRVKGNPKFYNGQNLGEICSDVTSYITPEDLEKYSPKEVKLKHFCFNDTSVAMKEIKTQARLKVYKEIIAQYKPAMRNVSKEKAENLIHGFKESNSNFDFDSASYCFDAVGTVLPYELEFDKPKKAVSEEEKVFWSAIQDSDELEQYKMYLTEYPDGYYKKDATKKVMGFQAKAKIALMKESNAQWKKIKYKKFETPFVEFIKKYPNSKYISKAKVYAKLYRGKKEELFFGVWEGYATQGNGASWSLKITLRKNKYMVDYPSLKCGGELQLLEKDKKSIAFREHIRYGSGCVNNGKVILSLVNNGNNELNYDWYYSNGKHDAHTVITKQ